MKRFSFNKRNLLVLVTISLSFVVLIYIIVQKDYEPSAPVQTSSPAPSVSVNTWNNLQPGKSTLGDISEKLGAPKDTDDSSNTVYYPSESEFIDNSIKIVEGRVSIIKTFNPIDGETFSAFIDKHGQPNTRLFGAVSAFGNYLYVYPTDGIAFIGNPVDNSITEIWYFESTTMNDFLRTHGASFSTQEIEQTHE